MFTGLLQLVGAGLIALGAYLLAPFLGLFVAGLMIFMLGWVLDGGGLPELPSRDRDDVNGSS